MAFCLPYMRSYVCDTLCVSVCICVRTFCSLSELVPNICMLIKCIFIIKTLTKKDDFCAQLNCCTYFCVEKLQFFKRKNLANYFMETHQSVVDLSHRNIYDGGNTRVNGPAKSITFSQMKIVHCFTM